MDSSLQSLLSLRSLYVLNSFNPCFNGFFSSIVCKASRRNTQSRVSILVLMDSSLQLDVHNVTYSWIQVSILVLMDSSLQYYNIIGIKKPNSVSILVLMDSSLQYVKKCMPKYIEQLTVSILVLMDSSLQSASCFNKWLYSFCFNPCFNGFFSSIRKFFAFKRVFYRVSILVLMDSSLQSFVGFEWN